MLTSYIWFFGLLLTRSWAENDAITCAEIEKYNITCKHKVPADCAFIPIEDRYKVDTCKYVYTKNGKDIEHCRWNPISPPLIKDKYLPCEPSICFEGFKYFKKVPEPGQIMHEFGCKNEKAEFIIDYPPSYDAMKKFHGERITDYQLDKLRCKFEKGEDIYKKVFTCLLPSCKTRLRIPEKSHACLPPIFPRSKLAYCPLYQLEIRNILSPKQIPPSNNYCYLPPLCDLDTKQINQDKSMIPYVQRTLNISYCEEICDNIQTAVNFTMRDPCRQLPPCLDDSLNTDPTYDQYQMSMCRPWCDDRDSLMRITRDTWMHKSNPVCMPKPLCFKNGQTPMLGKWNPWGYKRCVQQNGPCKYGMTSKTHHCVDEHPERNRNTLPNNDWIFLIFWPLSLLAFIATVTVTLLHCRECWWFKKKKTTKIKRRHALILEIKEELLINEAL